MRVQDLMTRPAATCRTSDTLNEAARIMWECDCGCVPVVEAIESDDASGRSVGLSRPVGMITDRDICMASYTQGKPLCELPVAAAMSKDLVTCFVDDSIENAEAILRRHQLRRLPVVNRDGSLAGILSLNDIATRTMARPRNREDGLGPEAVASTLAAICSRTTSLPAH